MGRTPENGIYPANRVVKFGVETITRVTTGTVEIEGQENLQEAVESGKRILFVFGPHRSHADGPIAEKSLKDAGFPLERVVVQGKKLNDRILTRTLVMGTRRIVVWPSTVDADTDEEKEEKIDINRRAMKGAVTALRNNESLIVFPEGTRSTEMIPADPDSALYIRAVKGGLVIPAGIIGGDTVLPKHAVLPKRYTPTVKFGKAMDADALIAKYADLPKEEAHRKMIDDVMVEIARMVPEEYRGDYYGKMIKDYEATY